MLPGFSTIEHSRNQAVVAKSIAISKFAEDEMEEVASSAAGGSADYRLGSHAASHGPASPQSVLRGSGGWADDDDEVDEVDAGRRGSPRWPTTAHGGSLGVDSPHLDIVTAPLGGRDPIRSSSGGGGGFTRLSSHPSSNSSSHHSTQSGASAASSSVRTADRASGASARLLLRTPLGDSDHSREAKHLFAIFVRHTRQSFLDSYYSAQATAGSPRGSGASPHFAASGTSDAGSSTSGRWTAFASSGSGSGGVGARTWLPGLSFNRIICPDGDRVIGQILRPAPTRKELRVRAAGVSSHTVPVMPVHSSGTASPGLAVKPGQTLGFTAAERARAAVAAVEAPALALGAAGPTATGKRRRKDRYDGETPEEAVRRPPERAMRNLCAITYGPFNWGTRREQCQWIYERLTDALDHGTPAIMMRAHLAVLHMYYYGSREKLTVMYDNKGELFDATRLQRRGFAGSGSPIISLLYVFEGFLNSLTDFLCTCAEAEVHVRPGAANSGSASSPASSVALTSDGNAATPHTASVPAAAEKEQTAAPLTTRTGGGKGNSGGAPVSPVGNSISANAIAVRSTLEATLMTTAATATTTASPAGGEMSFTDSIDSPRRKCRKNKYDSEEFLYRHRKADADARAIQGTILNPSGCEDWLRSLSDEQRGNFMHGNFEIMKGAVTVHYLDFLQPGRLTALEEYVVAAYVVTIRVLFGCTATILLWRGTSPSNRTCFGHGAGRGRAATPAEAELRAQEWSFGIVAYEMCVSRLPDFFAWATALRLRNKALIPKLRPLPKSFVQTI